MICYKSSAVEQAAARMRRDPKLSILVAWWHAEWPDRTIITESWRPALHPGDVHSLDPYRGVDLRSWVFSDPAAIEARVNRVWIYDPQRPHKRCCIYHKGKRGAWHFHLQTHRNTMRRAQYEKLVNSGRGVDPAHVLR